MHPQLLDRPDGIAAREHTGAAQNAAPAAQHTARPRLAPASASVADSRAPRDSETDRGAEDDDGVTRRRWLLRRRQWCQCVRLSLTNLGEPSIAAKEVARGGGDEHEGARPRHGRLWRDDGASALMARSPSISSPRSS